MQDEPEKQKPSKNDDPFAALADGFVDPFAPGNGDLLAGHRAEEGFPGPARDSGGLYSDPFPQPPQKDPFAAGFDDPFARNRAEEGFPGPGWDSGGSLKDPFARHRVEEGFPAGSVDPYSPDGDPFAMPPRDPFAPDPSPLLSAQSNPFFEPPSQILSSVRDGFGELLERAHGAAVHSVLSDLALEWLGASLPLQFRLIQLAAREELAFLLLLPGMAQVRRRFLAIQPELNLNLVRPALEPVRLLWEGIKREPVPDPTFAELAQANPTVHLDAMTVLDPCERIVLEDCPARAPHGVVRKYRLAYFGILASQ